MRRKVCSECGTPQQWENWPKCVCGGEFVPPPPRDPSLPPGEEQTPLQIAQDRARREQLRKTFLNAPKRTAAIMAIAFGLSAFFKPPMNLVLIALLLSFLGGMCVVFGAFKKSQWLPFFGIYTSLFTLMRIIEGYDLGLGGELVAVVAWASAGISLPFWIWRQRGLAVYATPDPVDRNSEAVL